MDHYLRVLADRSEVWAISDAEAFRLGIVNAPRYRVTTGQVIWDTLRKALADFSEAQFHPLDLGPGRYYPRIARPSDQHPRDSPGSNPGTIAETNVIAVARGQLSALTRQLDRICQTIHPAEQTLTAYGHDIRNLLILACTEVEAHWRGVLVANGYRQGKYSTNDYVRLQRALRLSEYSISFAKYPWLEGMSPFQGWRDPVKPTESLPWYSAYNAVKHDREDQFSQATLHAAFEAVSACFIMIIAQFGVHGGVDIRSEARSFFTVSHAPDWRPSEVYTYPYNQGEWVAASFDFSHG